MTEERVLTTQSHQFRGITGPFAAALVAALVWAGVGAAPATGDAAEPQGEAPALQVAITGIITDAPDKTYREESGTTFELDHGRGTITVDMAGWQWYEARTEAEVPLLNVGENVTVMGVVDDRFYSARTLGALSVFVRDRDAFLTVAPDDAGGAWRLRPMPNSPLIGTDPTTITLAGQVTAIDGDELSLDLGGSVVSVDTGPMGYDPLDDIGDQRVREGDWVQVSGTLDERFFEDRHLGALRITSIRRMAAEGL